MRCDACGFELTQTAKFCSECGEPVARVSGAANSLRSAPESASAPLDGERRQLTVLFSDLVGSTAMASRLDPEDWREVVSSYQAASAAVIERFGGYVAQYLGDGLVVYFGFPSAHEDDALRATRAGLGLIETLAEIEPRLARHHVRLAARVGIHTGTVVVGEVGSSSRKETLALGDTTNLAARLQEVAEPGTVVLSDATFRLVRGHFVTEERGVHALKGIQKPVTAYRATRPLRVRSTLGLDGGSRLAPLVGRREELDTLLARFRLANAGTGQVVVVSGEAGIGKSRMARALREEIGDAPHTWLETRASAYTQDSPLYPLVMLQEDGLGLAAFERPEQRGAQLERSLEQVGLSPGQYLPLFLPLHDLPLPARYAPLELTPEAQRRRTLDGLVEWFLRLAEEQSLVVLLEDLHWVDPTTLELVDKLIRRAPERRLLLVLTHRPAFEPSWAASPHLTALPLGRLQRADALALAASVKSKDRDLPDEVMREIVARSDGVPLFVEELTKTVLDAGAVPEGTAATVPATLQASLMARLDQLGAVKDVAQLCAALGREFPLELLLATTALPPEELDPALDRLVAAELLLRRGSPAVYSFKHALVQEQAYESLLRTTRQSYHRRIADVLQTRFPDRSSREPELLAHHYDAAGAVREASSYWLQAGQKSLARSAHVEASRQLQRGLDALARLPESPERDQEELFLLTMRGVALIAARGYGASEVEQAFARARLLCQKLGDTPHLFPVLFGLCLFYLVRAKPRETLELAAQIEAIATSTAEPDCVLEMHGALGAVSFWQGKFAAAQEHILKARTIFDPTKHGHHVFVYGQDPLAYGYIYGALASWFLGYPEQALLSAERALDLAERTHHPLTIAGVLSFSADLHHHLKNPAKFSNLAERTIAFATEQNLPMWASSARSMLGWARFQSGDHEAGIREIQAGLDAFRKTGAETNSAYLVSRLVEAYLAAGRIEEGLDHVEEALGLLETTLNRYYEAEVHRLKGELLQRASPPRRSDARTSFERALSVARAQRAKSLELRAATSLGRLLADEGRTEEAHSLVQGAYDWFTEGRETPDLVEAKRLLDGWSAAAGRGA